jgi:hypothetical protein
MNSKLSVFVRASLQFIPYVDMMDISYLLLCWIDTCLSSISFPFPVQVGIRRKIFVSWSMLLFL